MRGNKSNRPRRVDNIERKLKGRDFTPSVDPESLPEYATKDELPTKTSDLENDSGFITEVKNTNIPYSLFDIKWSDKIINNPSWLRSNMQWNDGSVYTDAYNKLISEYNNNSSDWNITTDEALYNQKYNNTGTAWYYLLDVANQRFKLPCSKNGFLQCGETGGIFKPAGLPNITGEYANPNLRAYLSTHSGAFAAGASLAKSGSASDTLGATSLMFNASYSNPIYGNSNTVQPNAVTGYLYFYVGETFNNPNLIDVENIQTSLTVKADNDLSNITNNGKKVIDGQWISAYNVLSTTKTRGTYTLDLSSYLPSDGNHYEVILYTHLLRTGSTSYASLYITIPFYDTEFPIANAEDAFGRNFFAIFPVIVTPSREISIRIVGSANPTACEITMLAYRRLGTNQ